MSASKFFVYGGGRWREVDINDGRVDGWGRAAFVYPRRGKIHYAKTSNVLAGLRDLAAGRNSSVKNSSILPQKKINALINKANNTERENGCDYSHCCQHANKNGYQVDQIFNKRNHKVNTSTQCMMQVDAGIQTSFPSQTLIYSDSQKHTRKRKRESASSSEGVASKVTSAEIHRKSPRKSLSLKHTRSINSLNGKKVPSIAQKSDSGISKLKTSRDTVVKDNQETNGKERMGQLAKSKHSKRLNPTKEIMVEKAIKKRKLRSEVTKEQDSLYEFYGQTNEKSQEMPTRQDQFKEIIIDESDVDVLRKYLMENTNDFDLYRFDADNEYKRHFFFNINPLVNLDRCPQIAEMLRRNQEEMSLKDFASKLGLKSISDVSLKSQRYRMRKIRHKNYTSSESDVNKENTEAIGKRRLRSNRRSEKQKTQSKSSINSISESGTDSSEVFVQNKPRKSERNVKLLNELNVNHQYRDRKAKRIESKKSNITSTSSDSSSNESIHNRKVKTDKTIASRISKTPSKTTKSNKVQDSDTNSENSEEHISETNKKNKSTQPKKNKTPSKTTKSNKVQHSDTNSENSEEHISETNKRNKSTQPKINNTPSKTTKSNKVQDSDYNSEDSEEQISETNKKNKSTLPKRNITRSKTTKSNKVQDSDTNSENSEEQISETNKENKSTLPKRNKTPSKTTKSNKLQDSDSNSEDSEEQISETNKENKSTLPKRNKTPSKTTKSNKLQDSDSNSEDSEEHFSETNKKNKSTQPKRNNTPSKARVQESDSNTEEHFSEHNKNNTNKQTNRKNRADRTKNKKIQIPQKSNSVTSKTRKNREQETTEHIDFSDSAKEDTVLRKQNKHAEIKLLAKKSRHAISKRASSTLMREYSNLEDHAIVSWLSTGDRARCVNGNRIWRELQDQYQNIAGQTRTWHSLRNRYLRYILPSLGAMALPHSHVAKLRAAAATGEIKSRNKVSRRNSIFGTAARGALSRRPGVSLNSTNESESDVENKERTKSPSPKRTRGTPIPSHTPRRSPRYSDITRNFAATHQKNDSSTPNDTPGQSPNKKTGTSKKSVEKTTKSVEETRKSVEKSRKSVEKTRNSLGKTRNSAEKPRKSIENSKKSEPQKSKKKIEESSEDTSSRESSVSRTAPLRRSLRSKGSSHRETRTRRLFNPGAMS